MPSWRADVRDIGISFFNSALNSALRSAKELDSAQRCMFPKILTQIFGSRNDRLLKTYRRTVQEINALEPQFEVYKYSAFSVG